MPARQTLRAWAMPSSRGTTVYESVLYTEGSTSCDCPAWVFHRKGGERTCKHIRQLAREIADTLAAPPTVWPPAAPAGQRIGNPTARGSRSTLAYEPSRSGQRPRRRLQLAEE